MVSNCLLGLYIMIYMQNHMKDVQRNQRYVYLKLCMHQQFIMSRGTFNFHNTSTFVETLEEHKSSVEISSARTQIHCEYVKYRYEYSGKLVNSPDPPSVVILFHCVFSYFSSVIGSKLYIHNRRHAMRTCTYDRSR